MKDSPAKHDQGVADETPHGADTGVRVVLVGRSDVERTLRRIREVELIRAREPLSAVGEVASPIDSNSPSRTVVLVSPGSVPRERTAAFATGIRRVDPAARVLSLDGPASAGFDGSLETQNASTDDLLADLYAATGVPVSRESAPAAEQPVELPPLDAPAAGSIAAPCADVVRVIDALLRGGDAVEAAMHGVRERLGVPNAAFVPASRIAPGAKPPTGGVPVRYSDRLLGYIVAPTAEREAVDAEAATLAGWVALAAQQDQLKTAAFTDELTGAWNRRYFTRFMGAAIEKARVARHSVAVLYFDLDNFKVYNDKYGHAAGDEILVETVKLLRSVIRPSDKVCRIGGDEFAVIFYDPAGPRDPGQGQAPSEIGPIARRFQQQICRHRFPKLGGEAPGTLTISGGLAAFPWDGADVNSLLDRADELALQSKRQGKNIITLGPGAERVCRLEE